MFSKRICKLCAQKNLFNGSVEVDENYFGPRRVRSKRGRENKVYAEIVLDALKQTLQGVI